MSGRSGYTNGNGYGDGSRYDQGYSNGDTRRANGYGGAGGGREPRVGGYGGLSEEPQQADYSTSPSRERSRARVEREQRQATSRSRTRDPNAGARRAGGRDETGYTSRSRGGEGSDGARRARGAQAIEDILQSIQRDWDFMASDECVPVQVGLQLMDNSTLGKADREPEFLEMHKQIQKTLKAIVNGEFLSNVAPSLKAVCSSWFPQSTTRVSIVLSVHTIRSKAAYKAHKPACGRYATLSKRRKPVFSRPNPN